MIACIHIPQIGIAVERKERPELRDKALALLDGSLVQVASTEAQTAGVRPGQTLSGARALCHEMATFSYRRAVYETAAETVWDMLAEESSFVEPVNPETAYVVLEHRIAGEQARHLIKSITDRVDAKVSIGIGRSKLIARQAASQTEDVLLIPINQEVDFLARLSIARFPIDAKVEQKLLRLGITTLHDLNAVSSHLLPRQLRESVYRLQQLAKGNDGDVVRPLWPRDSYSVRQSFDGDTDDLATLHRAMDRLSTQLSQMLSINAKYCRTYVLKIEYCDLMTQVIEEKLTHPTADATILFRAANELFDRLLSQEREQRDNIELSPQAASASRAGWHPASASVRSLLLSAGSLVTGSGIQRTLIDEGGNSDPEERRASLASAIDYVRGRWRPNAVVSADGLNQNDLASLTACFLGRRRNDRIDVTVDKAGRPSLFTRGGRTYRIVDIQDRWHERNWFWDKSLDLWVYRIQTLPAALAEIRSDGKYWRLTAMTD